MHALGTIMPQTEVLLGPVANPCRPTTLALWDSGTFPNVCTEALLETFQGWTEVMATWRPVFILADGKCVRPAKLVQIQVGLTNGFNPKPLFWVLKDGCSSMIIGTDTMTRLGANVCNDL